MGKKLWVLPDMYWPEVTSEGTYVSHESVCVLNTSEEDCTVTMTLFYEDREPIDGISVLVPSRRTKHIRMDQLSLDNDAHIPRGVPYAAQVTCSVDAVVQYTRVDTTQKPLALMTLMGY